MPQRDSQRPATGTTFGALYALLRAELDAGASWSAGPAAPPNPFDKEVWLDTSSTDRNAWIVKVYNSGTSAWDAMFTLGEIKAARGSKLSLDERLDTALNEDGTLKAATTLNPSEWRALSGQTFAFVSTTSFTVTGNQTDIFFANRRIKANLAGGAVYSRVVSSAFTTLTTVTIADAVLTATLTTVDFAIVHSDPAQTSLKARSLPIEDADGIIVGTEIETALKEIFDRAAQILTEPLQAYVESGGTGPTDATLTHTIAAVVAYPSGYRVTRAAESKTYTASKDTYVYILKAGTYSFLEVANGAAEPAQPADSLKLMKVVTSVSAITAVTDLRGTNPFPGVALLAGVNTFTGRQEWKKGADIASAATLTPGADGNAFDVSGTVTVTAIAALPAGTEITLRFLGSLALTHNATTLILRGGQNVQTYAGMVIRILSIGGGNWAEVDGSGSFKMAYSNMFDTGAGSLAFTPDMANGMVQKRVVNLSGTFQTPSNGKAGMPLTFYLIQDATGGRVITWGASWKTPGGTAGVLSTAANAVDIVSAVCRDGTLWDYLLNKDSK